jgi:hypothetical protein
MDVDVVMGAVVFVAALADASGLEKLVAKGLQTPVAAVGVGPSIRQAVQRTHIVNGTFVGVRQQPPPGIVVAVLVRLLCCQRRLLASTSFPAKTGLRAIKHLAAVLQLESM